MKSPYNTMIVRQCLRQRRPLIASYPLRSRTRFYASQHNNYEDPRSQRSSDDQPGFDPMVYEMESEPTNPDSETPLERQSLDSHPPPERSSPPEQPSPSAQPFDAISYKYAQKTNAKNSPIQGAEFLIHDAAAYHPYNPAPPPPRPSEITLELLLASQSHLGHHTSLWNPLNSRYIFGIRQNIHIISLDVTASHLRRACRVVSGVAQRGGLVLFVGTRAGHETCVVEAARRAGACHLFSRWIAGSITNGPQILSHAALKVVDEFDREISVFGAQRQVNTGNWQQRSLKPDLVVCMNPRENYIMLRECGMHQVPTIGIIDTDADPTWVTYPIPANDDSLRCVGMIAGVLGRAGEEGWRMRREGALNGEIAWEGVDLGELPQPTEEALEEERVRLEGA